MLILLDELVQKYGIQWRGVLHVGAHECEEIADYEKYLNRQCILWVEALPAKVQMLKRNFPGLLIENAVVSDREEEVNFNVANNGQSSSMLEFGTHRTHHPQVDFIGCLRVQTQLLKNILCRYSIDYNFLNLDIQGAELKALKGMEEYLSRVDYIYSEVNSDHVYRDCALVAEMDAYLEQFGFVRVETKWAENFGWGDAFYIRSSLLGV